jgi:hypothetical protein
LSVARRHGVPQSVGRVLTGCRTRNDQSRLSTTSSRRFSQPSPRTAPQSSQRGLLLVAPEPIGRCRTGYRTACAQLVFRSSRTASMDTSQANGFIISRLVTRSVL